MPSHVLRDSIGEKTPNLRKLSVKIEAVFNVDFLADGFGVVNDAHDHFIRVLGEHGKHICAERNIGVHAEGG